MVSVPRQPLLQRRIAPPNGPLEDDGPLIESMALPAISQIESEDSSIGTNTYFIYFIYFYPGKAYSLRVPIAIKQLFPEAGQVALVPGIAPPRPKGRTTPSQHRPPCQPAMDVPGFLPQDPPAVASATATPGTAFAAAALPWRPPPLPLGTLPRLRGKSTSTVAPESIVDARLGNDV